MREVNPALITDAPPPKNKNKNKNTNKTTTTLKCSHCPWLFLSSQANLPEGRADLWQTVVAFGCLPVI